MLFYQTLRLLCICVCLYIFSEAIASECFTLHKAPHICGFFYARGKGPAVDRETVFLHLGVTIGAQWAVVSAIGTGFYKLLTVFAKSYPTHMPQFYMPTIGNHRNNSKIAPISHYLVPTSTGKVWLWCLHTLFLARKTRVIETRDTQSVPHHNLTSSHFARQQGRVIHVIAMGRERV